MKILLLNLQEQDHGLQRVIGDLGYTVLRAGNRNDAQNKIAEHGFELLVLVPPCGDTEVVTYFAELREEHHLPAELSILAMGCPNSDQTCMADALHAGADYFLYLPPDPQHLAAKLRAISRKKEHVSQLKDQISSYKHTAYMDELTQIPNRRYLMKRLYEEVSRAHRHKRPLSLIMMDMDNLKPINDVFGHWAGDQLLVQMVKRVKGSLRDSDILCRYGGDEFFCLLPETAVEGSMETAERIRSFVSSAPFVLDSKMHYVTVSVGSMTYLTTKLAAEPDQVMPQLIQQVDTALYQAKSQGRNRVFHLNYLSR